MNNENSSDVDEPNGRRREVLFDSEIDLMNTYFTEKIID